MVGALIFLNEETMTLFFRPVVILTLLALPLMSSAAVKEPPLPVDDVRLFAEIFGGIKNFYVDDVSDKKLIENAIKGMVSGLDPHSSFLDEKGYKDLQESTSGEFGGLGIEITKDVQGVRVVSPIDDTPAARAGVRAGDIIIKIDNKVSADRSLDDNVKLMRGKPGTPITLTIARKGEVKPVVIHLIRAVIKIQSVKVKALDNHIGYIRISQFQGKTTADVAKALIQLSRDKDLKGLVLDLRNNPGGLLNAAVGVSAAFLKSGVPVVSTKGREKTSDRVFRADFRDYAVNEDSEDVLKSLPTVIKTVPMVVLVNGASASASEIVSGALQDHKRATLMGTQTFGKGSVQTIIPLRIKTGETFGLKMTTARYYTPLGRSIQAKGIWPDILVDDTPEGNYPSFAIREADLSGHIEAEKAETKIADKADVKDEANEPMPQLRYMFGDKNDFPLSQAVNFLTGKPVVTHADVLAAQKAKTKAGNTGDKK